MDPAFLAASIVAWLAPYLAKAGETITQKVGEKLYTAIKTRVETKPVVKEALADLEKTPTDADARTIVELQLKKLLTEDKEFAAQIEKMVQEAEAERATPSNTASEGGVAAGRDISGVVNTGDVGGSVTINNRQPENPS